MPSGRLPSDLTPNAVSRRLAELRERGIEILDLTLSNPTVAGLHYPADLLLELGSPAALTYEPQPLGLKSARRAVADDFARRGVMVEPDRIAITASTSEAYAFLFKLLCDPGDNVLVPTPSYPLFEHLARLELITARPYRLEYHGHWQIDVEQLHRAIDRGTRAVLVVSPNNPTGSVVTAAELAHIQACCAATQLPLIVDEVFADFPLRSIPQSELLESGEAVICRLGGLSKSIGLPQVKLGWIAFEGPLGRVESLMSDYEIIADTYLSVGTPPQIALPTLFRRGASVRIQIQERIRRNLTLLRELVANCPSIELLQLDAGWSAVLRVPAYQSEEALALDLLTQDHVLVHPGYFFDFEHEAFLIISLLVAETPFHEGIERVLTRAAQPAILR